MLSIVKIISTEIDGLKRRIAKYLRFGKHDVQTSIEIGPYGIDSNPIKDMVALYAPTGTRGKTVIVGYINKNQLAAEGELRIYSTDSNGGEMFYAWLKNDGTMEIGGNAKNMVRFQELEAGFNELKDKVNAVINRFNTHTHTSSGSGPPAGSPVSDTNASIAGAKIEEIRTL